MPRKHAALVLYLAALVIFTGILAPRIMVLLHRAGATGASLEDVTLRTLELVAIALTFPLLWAQGQGGRGAWGVPPARGLPARLARGVCLGVASLAPVCLVLLALDVRVVHVDLPHDALYWLGIVARAALAAAVIAAMEEFWFRGGLTSAVAHCTGPAAGLWLVAVVYAATHFLDAADMVASNAQASRGGFQVLGAALSGVFRLQNLGSFVALLVAGLALGVVRLRQGDVALCIGIHAGWVLTIKVFKKITYLSPDSDLQVLAGRYDGVVGWLAAACLGALLLALWRMPVRERAGT